MYGPPVPSYKNQNCVRHLRQQKTVMAVILIPRGLLGGHIGQVGCNYTSAMMSGAVSFQYPPSIPFTDSRPASLAIAIQSYSVLALSASLTTYLLNIHYTLGPITAARSLSSVIEFSSTIIMPLAVSRLTHPDRDPLVALTKVGVVGLLWQCVTLLPATISLLLIPTTSPKPESSHLIATGLFFVLLALSRLGFWTCNLVELTIVQISVSPASRAEFSGIEMAFMSAAEIGRWGITGVLPRSNQFKGVAISGLAVVFVSFLLFLSWAQSRHPRGTRSLE